ncbi:uncharacterized tatc-like protein ymf16 [Phtheirospermum japonicum]|uniref:Uncharacterized tatc-like protein ymf16 n=1 Tax=Phtheirospermum japonicum TaxID=374723 RepID=A0A830D049_9LAMI|nr:uncharacterized tatc-like protein ymf16 [Phtheirospermum japonicum]
MDLTPHFNGGIRVDDCLVGPLLTAALSTPPDIWCQIFACFLISLIIELAIFVASIVQVREEGWTSGMRESGSIDKKEE